MVHACPQTREGKSRIHVEETEELSHKMNLFPAFKQLVMKKIMKIMKTPTWRSSWCFRVPMGHHTRFGRDEQWLAPALGEARCFSPMKLFLKAQKVILSIYWKTSPQGWQKHPIWQWQRSGDETSNLLATGTHFVGSPWAVEDSTWDLGSSSKCSITPGEDVGDSDLHLFDVDNVYNGALNFNTFC